MTVTVTVEVGGLLGMAAARKKQETNERAVRASMAGFAVRLDGCVSPRISLIHLFAAFVLRSVRLHVRMLW